MLKHLTKIRDLSKREINAILDSAGKIKQKPGAYSKKLANKTLAMMFEKPSTRTRLSFEVGMTQLGGHAIFFDKSSSQISRGETIEDTARVLSRYVDAIMARVLKHETVEKLAEYATVPVINGLSDLEHPCQTLADLFTMRENKKLGGKIVYVGDGNNVANSLVSASEILGLDLTVSCPKGYEPKYEAKIVHDPKKAAQDADVLYTDVWVSMGDEAEKKTREKIFSPYQLNSGLLKLAKKDAIVLHCLPAHRGMEISSDVLDGKQSRVLDQAENRLHVQKAVLLELLK